VALANPRTHIVTFRVSSAELEILHKAARMEGARSLSDFARVAVLARAAEHHDTSEQGELLILHKRSEQLRHMLLRLDDRLRQASETETSKDEAR
jgi:uncharacterized protein (DUF1778 family)